LDQDAAWAIQRSLQPQYVPRIAGYSLSFRATASHQVSGDYVDVIPLADGRWMLIVADVAGKGLSSTIVSMRFRSALRAISRLGLSLADMAWRLNRQQWYEGPETRLRYMTAIFACLDPRNHSVEAVNAGHSPALLLSAGEVFRISASGPPLGMLPNRRYSSETHFMSHESNLLLYTDGLTKLCRGNEEFGEHRLRELMKAPASADFLNCIWTTARHFAGGEAPADDMAALHLYRYRGQPTMPEMSIKYI
jgi:serine phosphatase RsbU (regulator of sigma subunit)